MRFKRKFRGYDIEETDIFIEELLKKENRVLEKEEELLTLLMAEGEALEMEFQRLSQLLEKSRERNLRLAGFQSMLEKLFHSGDFNRENTLALLNNLVSEQTLPDTLANPGFRALVVDDDPTILAMLKAILERENIAVYEASDGQQASDLIDAIEPPNIILLDIMLPYVDGLALVKKIRKTEGWTDVPIIMLTGKSSEDIIVTLLKAGANDYVTKPFNIKELVARIKKLMVTA